jgi:hypothetical protein
MITLWNDGPIDVRAIKTFGVNAKIDNESAIGYFGTGLKYAIAILLRNNHHITIYTGGEKYEFNVVESDIRGSKFNIVTMNGEELGFTTELGKDWEMWMAFRELYSNMLDEKGSAWQSGSHPRPEEYGDDTWIVVEGVEFEVLYKNRDVYFLNTEKFTPIEKHHEVDIYNRMHRSTDKGSVFYKGVRVMETRLPSLFDYNHSCGLTLTEDRTIRDTWSTLWHVGGAVLASTDERLITKMVMAPELTYESRINYTNNTTGVDKEFFLDVVGKLRKRYKDIGLNPSAIQVHKESRRVVTVMPKESCPLNNVEQQQWDKATTFCKDTLGLGLDAYQLLVVEDIGKKGVMGLANIEKGIMYISKLAFRKGTKAVAVAILEEFTHVHHEVEDETVQQKWVYLDQIVSLGERLSGEPL